MAPTAIPSVPLDIASTLKLKNRKVVSDVSERILAQKYDDWRQDLMDNGYAVVKGAIPREKAIQYQQDMFAYMKTFGPVDFKDPETWVAKNLPISTHNNVHFYYACNHEKFMWDVRTEPGVVDAFAKLWGTDELLVSFDGFNITLPNRKDKERVQGWQHVDQSPFRKGLHCAQGIVSLSHAGDKDGGLVVYKGSHKYIEEFFETVDKSTWTEKDIFLLTNEQLQWFLDRGCEEIKVNVEPGDLIIWDSRTIHWGKEPEPGSEVVRSIIYASYTPRAFATEEALEVKTGAFNSWLGTTHWAHDNINPRKMKPMLPDGTLDPRDRDEPVTKPVITEQILKLAGVKPY